MGRQQVVTQRLGSEDDYYSIIKYRVKSRNTPRQLSLTDALLTGGR